MVGTVGYTQPMEETQKAGDVSGAEMQSLATSLPPEQWDKVKSMLAMLPDDAAREKWFKEYTANHTAGRLDAQDAMTRADALRVEQPGMGGEPGGYQVAASPLAHIGAGMQNYQANKQYKQGQADLAAANEGMGAQDATTAKIMAGQYGQPQATPGINPSAGKAGAMRALAAGGPGRGAAPGGPAAMVAGGPGRGAAPGGMPPGMTPEMMQKMMMLRSR